MHVTYQFLQVMQNGTEKLKFLRWYPLNLSPKKELVLSQVYFLTKEHEMNKIHR